MERKRLTQSIDKRMENGKRKERHERKPKKMVV